VLGETWAKTRQGAGLCVGRPFRGVTLRIVRLWDGPIATLADSETLPAGEVGELVVHGPHVSPAYFRDEASTRNNKIAGSDGEVWHRIGDAGYLDDAGRFWYCGRVGQRVRSAEGPLFSLQCEPIFDAHPAVRRSGLVGVPDGAHQRAVICIERRPEQNIAEATLRAELLALAAAHPRTRPIREVLFRKRLPVDPRHNSKIERPALARWAQGQLRKR
jgi:acyl-CoA synthetase (AMP-forming)/AMP-acid ligase II